MSSDEERVRREEKERERNRRQIEKRPRQWVVASDDEDDNDKAKRIRKDERKHRRHEKHTRRSRSRSPSDDYSASNERHESRKRHSKHSEKKKKKHRRKKHHKKKRHRRDHDDSSNGSSGESDYSSSSREDRSRKKRKKKRKKSKANSEKGSSSIPTGAGSFGKYGILKPSDFYKQQRSFEVWMAEVKGIPAFTGPKWELQKYFAEYCEDYNTATMPHEKYYNYDEWEMKEYKKRQEQAAKAAGGGGAIADEARHRAMLEQQRHEKQQAELDLVKARMSQDKIEEMKHQALLKSTMAHAYKTGDEETRKRLQQRLEPEDDRNKKTSSHPWSR